MSRHVGKWLMRAGWVAAAMVVGVCAWGADGQTTWDRLREECGAHLSAGRYREAESSAKQLLELAEKSFAREPARVSCALFQLASAYDGQGRYAEAGPLYKRSLAIDEKVYGPEHPEVATGLNSLAEVYRAQSRYAEAEPLYQRSLGIREKSLGPQHPDVAVSLNNLALLYWGQSRYAEAEPLYQRAVAIDEKAYGPEHPEVATDLDNLALLYCDQGRYTEAEPLHQRSWRIREKALGPDHPDVAKSLNSLAALYRRLGRCAEAEPLQKRSLVIFEKALGSEHPYVARSMNNLAGLYEDQGRYAEAEPLYKRSLTISERVFGAEHREIATSLNNLATLYANQGRNAEAEPLLKRSLSISEKSLGPEHPDVATGLNNLAALYQSQERYAEAELLYQRSLAIGEKVFGAEHRNVALSLNNLAHFYKVQNRHGEAEPLLQRSLAIRENSLGPQHPDVAIGLKNLALLREAQGRPGEAEPLVDRAIEIFERTRSYPERKYEAYCLRARLSWQSKRRGDALRDLRRAMELAEQLRTQTSGTEHERAASFSKYLGAFEWMVRWQSEMTDAGDVGEAFEAMERRRNRSLLDELAATGIDLQVGRSAIEREQLLQEEGQRYSRVATLERRLADVKDPAERARLEGELALARDALYEQYRDERSTSPVYRGLLVAGGGLARLTQVQRWLGSGKSLMLVYLLGAESGYVLAITDSTAELTPLTVNEELASVLGVPAGPLAADKLHAVLLPEKGAGVLKQLGDPQQATGTTAQLHALWQVLVPASQRAALLEGRYQRLLVVPDGSLALLPFETLVTAPGERPVYFLDGGPATVYGPSATLLYTLAQRPEQPAGAKPVLTVGDPAYDSQPAASAGDTLGLLAPRSRYRAGGGLLKRLPHSGLEAQWVAQTFRERGQAADELTGEQATEPAVRQGGSGRRIVHLACHGLVDQSYGNFFGALALAPVAGRRPQAGEDGYLTLPEIYELNLAGCELAILSACDTNFGPRQQGEGVWSLSRGFVVAGARRVVASNWLVDDEAAATLMTYFAHGLAEGPLVDCAEKLRVAKRAIRRETKWQSPYYWAGFVLMGPN